MTNKIFIDINFKKKKKKYDLQLSIHVSAVFQKFRPSSSMDAFVVEQFRTTRCTLFK